MNTRYALLKSANNQLSAIALARLLAICLCLVQAGGAVAMDFMENQVQVHGFLTQGMVRTDRNNFYGNSSEHASFDFREIGINGSYRVNPGLRLAAQVMSRTAGEMDDGRLWLDFAMADFTLLDDENKRAGVRLGRMKNAYGLYTETRDVAFTRPGVILPQPIYFDRTRNLVLSGDGAQFYGEFAVPGGNLEIVASASKLPTSDRSSKATLVAPNAPGELEQGSFAPGLRVLYETENRQWRGGLTYCTLSQSYRPAAGDRIPPTQIDFAPWIASLQYTDDRWTLTGEYSQRKTKVVSGPLTIMDGIAENWYLQGQYRFAPGWELLLRYDSAITDMDDRNGQKAAAKFGYPTHSRFTYDWVAGLRHDLTPSFMVRAEVHHVDGTNWLSALDNPAPAKMARHWNMFMLLGSYRF